jgi:hypothetical protein
MKRFVITDTEIGHIAMFMAQTPMNDGNMELLKCLDQILDYVEAREIAAGMPLPEVPG